MQRIHLIRFYNFQKTDCTIFLSRYNQIYQNKLSIFFISLYIYGYKKYAKICENMRSKISNVKNVTMYARKKFLWEQHVRPKSIWIQMIHCGYIGISYVNVERHTNILRGCQSIKYYVNINAMTP